MVTRYVIMSSWRCRAIPYYQVDRQTIPWTSQTFRYGQGEFDDSTPAHPSFVSELGTFGNGSHVDSSNNIIGRGYMAPAAKTSLPQTRRAGLRGNFRRLSLASPCVSLWSGLSDDTRGIRHGRRVAHSLRVHHVAAARSTEHPTRKRAVKTRWLSLRE